MFDSHLNTKNGLFTVELFVVICLGFYATTTSIYIDCKSLKCSVFLKFRSIDKIMENLKRIYILLVVHILLLSINYSESYESVSVLPGIEIVPSKLDNNEVFFDESNNNSDLFQRTFNYLKTHELKFELSNFINGSDIEKMFRNVSDHLQPDSLSSSGTKCLIFLFLTNN